jgi:hypothetical protein
MIVETISYTPCNAWSPATAPVTPPNRKNPAIPAPRASGTHEDGDLPPTGMSAPISPRSWPRLFPGL